jgi:hypothetical protein
MHSPSCKTLCLCLALAAAVTACSKSGTAPPAESAAAASIPPAEAQAIAKEAYIYGYPMLENYRTLYVQAIDRNARGYMAPFNELVHKTQLLGPEFKDVVRPNNDTIYSFAWLNLRAQPMVISVPDVEDRYYSVQLVDMFTHNIGYIGTRATGGKAGSYLVAGPDWNGSAPAGVSGVFRSETNFVYCIIRTEVRGPPDLEAVHKIQRGYSVTPLNVFLGHKNEPEASGITFPIYDAERVKTAAFIDTLNFLLSQVDAPSEADLMERFSKIGIRPGAIAASLDLAPETRGAIDAGVGEAMIAIQSALADPASVEGLQVRSDGGWEGVTGLFGDGEEMRPKYLVRAAAAMSGLYGNDAVEAYYPVANQDPSGSRFDGSKDAYVMRFEKDELPDVRAFWSMTMYSLPSQLMVENPINRYSIGDRSALRYEPDGSLVLYIQRESPGRMKESNWLPAPDGPFSLQFRMYLPAAEMLSPLYLPPPVEPAN